MRAFSNRKAYLEANEFRNKLTIWMHCIIKERTSN